MLACGGVKVKFCRSDLPETLRAVLETQLPVLLANLPADKWRTELARRVKTLLERTTETTKGPWHCAVGTKFALNTTNKGRGFAHLTLGPYIHLVVWQTTERVCPVPESTDLESVDPVFLHTGGTSKERVK